MMMVSWYHLTYLSVFFKKIIQKSFNPYWIRLMLLLNHNQTNNFPNLMLMRKISLKYISRGLKYSTKKGFLTMSSIKCA